MCIFPCDDTDNEQESDCDENAFDLLAEGMGHGMTCVVLGGLFGVVYFF